MEYPLSERVQLGDQVLIDSSHKGVVVANIEDKEFSEAYPAKDWAHLEKGVLIDTDFGGLIHYDKEALETDHVRLSSRN